MKNKIFILCMLVLIILPLISAEQIFSRFSNSNIIIVCEHSGEPCSMTAECNLSLFNQNGTILLNNVLMSRNEDNFNYSIDNSITSDIGTYSAITTCIDGDYSGITTFEILITPSGSDKINSGEGLTLVGALFIIILISIIFFVFGFKTEGGVLKIILFSVAVIFVIVAIFFTMVIVDQNLGGFSNIVSGYSTFFFIVEVVVGVLITAFLIFTIFVAFKMWQFKRGLLD